MEHLMFDVFEWIDPINGVSLRMLKNVN